MKKIWTIIAFSIFLIIPLEGVKAQMVVELGALTQTIMEKTKAEQILYYVQMVEQQIESVKNTYDQLQAAVRAEERAIENLKGITNVDSYGDFMNWYNSQLYLERQAENRFKNMSVKVGDKSYNLKTINEISDGINNTYGSEYWNDFSPAQRRRMWINLGLTPQNYVYQQTWKAKQEQMAELIVTNSEMTREDNLAAAERHANIVAEANKEGTGEKAILQALLDIMLDTNHAIRKGNQDAADKNAYDFAKDRVNATPNSFPDGFSDMWDKEMFGSITEEQGIFID